MAFAAPYDMALKWNLNGLGYTLIGVATAWTTVLAGGMVFLVINRHLPFLRIRSTPLALSAVALLHVYWVLCLLAYVLNGNFPCTLEFWIMSIYLPLGVALYQATNTQLLYVAALQSEIAAANLTFSANQHKRPSRESWRRPLAKWRSASATKRTMACIAIGMGLQLLVSTAIFLASRIFHPGWGLVGHPDLSQPQAARLKCRQGPEWIPSIVWQVFWAWCYAPYLLWKVRKVRDIHGWRQQTIVCCIAGLPATPLWLASLYASQHSFFGQIRQHWISPMWFAPCIFLMEASVIFIPCWHIVKNDQLRNETLDVIAEWERKQSSSPSVESDSTKVTRRSLASQKDSFKSTTSSRRGEMYTMKALEKTIETNPTPLLLFSSFKDFSGENIQFLSSVQQWKVNWNPMAARNGLFRKTATVRLEGDALRCQQFDAAVRIYSSFISLQYSNYPVNLSSGHYKELEAMFEGSAAVCNAHLPAESVTPFNRYWYSNHSDDLESAEGNISTACTANNNSTETILTTIDSGQLKNPASVNVANLGSQVHFFVEAPDAFGPHVFDNSEKSIKYMVLTNTWPKFVAAGYASATKKRTMVQSTKVREIFHYLTLLPGSRDGV